jgi:hypothetical protein
MNRRGYISVTVLETYGASLPRFLKTGTGAVKDRWFHASAGKSGYICGTALAVAVTS